MTAIKVLICDLIGLRFDTNGQPDFKEAKAYIEERGGIFHDGPLDDPAGLEPEKLHFFYQPELSTHDELIIAAGDGQYDAVIAAATFIPRETIFPLGGVRIGAGTGNMGSESWGGGTGNGGTAPLMNTPGINSRATAQMVMKALLKVRPDLPVDKLHELVATGNFDTGKQLRYFPTEKLEGKRMAVIGYGNIGREVAKLGRAFGMSIAIHARPRHQEWIEAEGFEYAPTIIGAASGADALSIHIGLGNFDESKRRYANVGVIGDEVLQALNHGAVLINYDRGELVDVHALSRALSSGKVAHAAIDADLFKDSVTGALSGPMLPYLKIVEKFGEHLEFLPHAAADTDHPSRVAGAKQAIDQIFKVIEEKCVYNLKGTLPEGYRNGGARAPAGIGTVTAENLLQIAASGPLSARLAHNATVLGDFWKGMQSTDDAQAFALRHGREMILASHRLAHLLRQLGLNAPYDY